LISIYIVLALTAGGTGSNTGAVVGAFLVVFFLESTRFVTAALPGLKPVQVAAVREFLIGASLIVVLRVRPAGLVPARLARHGPPPAARPRRGSPPPPPPPRPPRERRGEEAGGGSRVPPRRGGGGARASGAARAALGRPRRGAPRRPRAQALHRAALPRGLARVGALLHQSARGVPGGRPQA